MRATQPRSRARCGKSCLMTTVFSKPPARRSTPTKISAMPPTAMRRRTSYWPMRSGALTRRSRLDLLDQLRDRLEQVGRATVVVDLEDRRVGLFVDGADHLRALHAREV